MTINERADRVASLLEARMRLRGRGLSEKLRKAGRRLPRKLREAAQILAKAQDMAQNPKLMGRIDEAEVVQAYDLCLRYLGKIGPGATRSIWASAAASVGLALLAVLVLVLGVVYWRGLV